MASIWVAKDHEKGMKLVSFIKEKIQTLSAKKIKSLLEKNCCQVNKQVERFAKTVIDVGDEVIFSLEEIKTSPLDLLFEDENCLVYNKTVGIVCDEERFFPHYLVHRLDKETTGCLIVAKHQEAKKKLDDAFRTRHVKKEYLALVKGVPIQKQGRVRLRHALLRRIVGQAIWGEHPSGKEAITDWRCLKRGRRAALILCTPITGRTHQVRVHLKSLGHPIVGDYHYDRTPFFYPAKRVLLHASRLLIPSLQVDVEAPLPKDFLEAEKGLFA